MKKSTKTIIGVVVIILLIAGVSWAAYEATKSEPVDMAQTNEVASENMGITNTDENAIANETENVTAENEIANETVANEVAQNTTTDDNTDKNEECIGSGSEVVTGTNATREERAVELAKKYYEETYGSTDGVYFTYDSVNGDGRYIVIAGTAGSGSNKFLLVDLNAEEVTEK